MRSIDVIGAHSDEWQLKAAPVRADHHFRRRLACRVWVRRREDARLAEVRRTHWHIPIHLIRGDVYEAIDSVLSCSLKQDMRAVNVCVGELI